MQSPSYVMLLNTDKQIKAAILCDRLVWAGIMFAFEVVGVQYTVTVAESDVAKALTTLGKLVA